MDAAITAASERQARVLQDAEARELYEMRQKAERDRRSELAFAEEKGMKKGRLEGQIELLDLLDKGYTAEDIRRKLESR